MIVLCYCGMNISKYDIYDHMYMYVNPFSLHCGEESALFSKFGEEYMIYDEVHVCDPRHCVCQDIDRGSP